ncbi:MAG TPA: hemerythrin domain-containing protein [Acidimicrobiales bacterium]|jgi:hemerythrin superfamily protein|nr:hemerythrin domain-containing protein [Acidimicrobiales bacterium]
MFAGAGRRVSRPYEKPFWEESEMADSTDLIELLLEDHKTAETLLGKVGEADVDQSELFDQLVHDLVGHEVAEEEIVYPVVRSSIPQGDALADARIAEQQKAEELLSKMEQMDQKSAEFSDSMAKLRDEALAHAQAEEREVFPKLKEHVNEDRRSTLGQAYKTAKATAPTHPHPHAPNTPPGNMAAGSIAAVADRVRDAAKAALHKIHA